MASKRRLSFILTGLALGTLLTNATGAAQEPAQPSVIDQQQQTTTQDEQKQAQAALEKQALKLLDQTVAEAQSLRLPENRLRVQVMAGDALWTHDEARARSLFAEAGAGLGALVAGLANNDQQQFNTAVQVRRETLNVIAQRDPSLALDILRATRLPQAADNRLMMRVDPEANFEFGLLTLIAANDPKQALQKAEEMLSKGEYSGALLNLLAKLQTKDKDAAARLTEDILKALRGENLTTNQNARNLALSLLRPGPRSVAAKTTLASVTGSVTGSDQATPANSGPLTNTTVSATLSSAQVLDEAAYRELLEAVINSALSVTPQSTAAGARGGGAGGRGGGPGFGPRINFGNQNEANGTLLLASVRSLLPQIDKYAPTRAALVRQKLTAAGISTDQPTNVRDQMNTLMQQGSVDAMLNVAAQVPPGAQGRFYQQAAMQAVEEGNPDRARQIANDHLSPDERTQVLQAIERQQVVRAATQGRLEEAQQMLARLQSDEERLDALTQIAALLVKNGDKKPAQQLLEEARTLVSRRAENYQQLEAQLRVAQAFADIDPARSFEVLAPGISQINELLGAAALLNGFEGRFFKDGELPLRGGGSLSGIITEYAQELAALARLDFDEAQATADKFQRLEPRLIAKLTIARGVLGGNANTPTPNNFNRRAFRRGN